MDFEQAHKEFLDRHVSLRQGERKGRLLRGHQYAEKLFLQNVWWPLFGNFDRLHPEYEIYDWNRKSQFLDFAFIAPFGRFGLECDGFQSHVKDMDRERFSYALNRDTFLTGMGWKMLHFSFDDVQNRPEICRTLLQLAVAPYLIRNKAVSPPVLIEKEVLRLAWGLGRWIRPKDVCDHLEVDFRTARKWLRSLVEKGWLQPIARGRDIRYYELNATALKQLW
ncbi:BlaI/MecI/CopY family transcriptional regulator [Paenibacillus sp. MSJ-34]|uniref:BlaI/MecI/CopY family transcriptional regulator n=1 Tax=Paenibacillus sp. MSJ-34 TaxID=2841529 RepID=UPI001C11E42B|nr:BlaI/MecI/CopY family transcriptional regulator [Paenibacillus sp. MSJ-34]MBU5445121.1 BlaI/MecI/CopY family transcriptional regulator [Paenibacillus sp. MSJ-34]